jgi:hypothetical protein
LIEQSGKFVHSIQLYLLSFTYSACIHGKQNPKFHPMCKREIQVKDDGKLAVVLGEDGNPGCESGSTTKSWKLSGKVEGDSIYVDFSPKGGPKDLVGKWEDAAPQGIRWPDSNKWTRLVKEQVTS